MWESSGGWAAASLYRYGWSIVVGLEARQLLRIFAVMGLNVIDICVRYFVVLQNF
jgi:hypothetical protein